MMRKEFSISKMGIGMESKRKKINVWLEVKVGKFASNISAFAKGRKYNMEGIYLTIDTDRVKKELLPKVSVDLKTPIDQLELEIDEIVVIKRTMKSFNPDDIKNVPAKEDSFDWTGGDVAS